MRVQTFLDPESLYLLYGYNEVWNKLREFEIIKIAGFIKFYLAIGKSQNDPQWSITTHNDSQQPTMFLKNSIIIHND